MEAQNLSTNKKEKEREKNTSFTLLKKVRESMKRPERRERKIKRNKE